MGWRRFLGWDFDTLCGMDNSFLLNPYFMHVQIFRVFIRPFLNSTPYEFFLHVHAIIIFVDTHPPLAVKANGPRATFHRRRMIMGISY
jgi:hypothetical protein